MHRTGSSEYFRTLIVATFVFLTVISASQRSFLHATTEYDDTSVDFLFFGDSGKGNSDQFRVAKSMEKFCSTTKCDFVALLGDNVYPVGVKSVDDPQWGTKWWNAYKSLGLVFHAALGNHDYGGSIQAEIDYSKKNKYWYMPDRYYKFEKGEVEFFVLDTEKFDAKQADWLSEALDNSTANVKIAYGHHPIYSYGEHGHTRDLIRDLLPILRGKVNLYLAGHDHDKQVLESPGDPPMLVVGTAAALRPVAKGSKTIFAASTLGFGHLSISPLDVKVRIVDVDLKTEFEKSYSVRTP